MRRYKVSLTAAFLLAGSSIYANEALELNPQWDKTTGVVKTALSIHVCPEPPLRRESPIHARLFQSVRDLKADYARFQPWFPYPKLAVAELEPPAGGKTSWDFSIIDPLVIDFMDASEGRSVVFNFGTIPQWMLKRDKPNTYPADPNEIDWGYSVDTNQLRDPSFHELRDYYVRLASWYTKGGFTDEHGKKHVSGHNFKIDYWEVLNEMDAGDQRWSPREYTRLYDEVVGALKKVQPQMKFGGLVLADPFDPEYFEYFLNRKNHKPGIPLDMISWHFYAIPSVDESPDVQQYTFFEKVDGFAWAVKYAQAIRNRLSPTTKTYVNELGSSIADMLAKDPQIPTSYWNLSGSMFAYAYIRLAQLGVDAIAGAELINYPGQFPGGTLSDWSTGEPNARYWALKLLRDQIHPGDRMIETMNLDAFPRPIYAAQAFVTPQGERKLLIVNKRDRPQEFHIPGAKGASIDYVDQITGSKPPAHGKVDSDTLRLSGYSVAVVHLRN